MCLQRLGDFNVRLNKDEVGTGYKVFREFEGKLFGEYARTDKERRAGIWLKEENFRPLKTDDGLERIGKTFDPKYKPGWHVFLKRQTAEKWRSVGQHITKIKFRGIVTTGIGAYNGRIVVAKEIFIPKEA